MTPPGAAHFDPHLSPIGATFALLMSLSILACGSSTDLHVDDAGHGLMDGGVTFIDAGVIDSALDASTGTTADAEIDSSPDASAPDAEIEMQQPVVFGAEVPALPEFGWDTGLQPGGSPVQLQFRVSSSGKGGVDAIAIASGYAGEPVLTAVPESGNVWIRGAFEVEARLVIGITGLPKYDGPFPRLNNLVFDFDGEQRFDPYLLDGTATAEAEIPAVGVPDIPLPGGLPGKLILTVAEGSTVNLSFHGVCAAIQENQAQYRGELSRGGSFVLRAKIEIDVPGLGIRTFGIPDITVPIKIPARDIDLGTKEVLFGAPPSEPGETAMFGTCGSP